MSDKNDCQNRREAIAAFVLGELEAKAADELKKHIDACETCRSLYQSLLEEEEVIQSAFKAIGDRSESIQEGLVEQLDKHKEAALQEEGRPRRSTGILSAIMKSRVTKLAAAAVILIGVFIGIHQTGRPIRVTSAVFADMIEAMKQKPWMHIVMESSSGGREQQFEVWVSFESQVGASKRSSGEATYLDGQMQVSYRYNPGEQAITVAYVDASEITKGATSVWNFWEIWLRQMTEAGMSITEETGQFEGHRAKIYKIKGSLGEKSSVSDKLIKTFRGEIIADMEQKLPVFAHEKLFDSKGNLIKDKKLYFDYPDSGPKDIYALGVPATAKVLYEGAESEVQLAAELKQVEAMFVTADIDGLVAMLSDAKFEDSKVMAANYLAQIGDSRAIEPLDILSAEWTGDAQDNPYSAAIREIKERLEQDATTEELVKSGEDSTEDKAVTSLTPAVGLTGSSSVYDHFLFTRVDKEDGQKKTKNLVIARVTAGGFELREIDTGPYDGKPGYRWEYPLCVIGGTLYCKEWSDSGKGLISMDLTTGEIHRIGNLPGLSLSYWDYRSPCCYNDGRLYAVTGNETKTLQVLDFHRRAYRNIVSLEQRLELTPIAVSPDHKRIAFFADDPNRRSSRVLLRIVDAESGEISYPIEPIEHSEHSGLLVRDSTLPPLLPVIWLDGERVLFVQAASSELPARLVCVNVTTGDMNDVTPLPGRSSPSEVPLIQDNTGQAR